MIFRYLDRIVLDRTTHTVMLYEAVAADSTDGVAPAPIALPFSFLEIGSVKVGIDASGCDTLSLDLLTVNGVEIVPSAVPE